MKFAVISEKVSCESASGESGPHMKPVCKPSLLCRYQYRPFYPKYTLKFPLFTKLLPKVYQTIPGVYQKWRKFKYSCTARTLCSISTDTGNSYWYSRTGTLYRYCSTVLTADWYWYHPCSCALCGLPKVYSWIPTVYLNSELRFPVFT